jgi:hypothetical protein
VEQVFALQVDFGAAELLCEAAGEEEWSVASGVSAEEEIEALLVLRIALGFVIFAFEFLERGHEGFGNIAATVSAETSGHGFMGSG